MGILQKMCLEAERSIGGPASTTLTRIRSSSWRRHYREAPEPSPTETVPRLIPVTLSIGPDGAGSQYRSCARRAGGDDPDSSGLRVWLAVGRTDMMRRQEWPRTAGPKPLQRDPNTGDFFVSRGAQIRTAPNPSRPVAIAPCGAHWMLTSNPRLGPGSAMPHWPQVGASICRL